jgi:hypothetical protein
MNETSTITGPAWATTFGIAGGSRDVNLAGGFDLRTDELSTYGLVPAHVPEKGTVEEVSTAFPPRRVAYFAKSPNAPSIEYYPVHIGEECTAPDELPEVSAKGIESTLNDLLAMFCVASVASRAGGDATRPSIRLQSPPRMGGGSTTKLWIVQEQKDFSNELRLFSGIRNRLTARKVRPLASEGGSKLRQDAARLIDRLSGFANLRNCWNGYSASAPTQVAIDGAKAMVTIARDCGMIAQRVEPSAMGGVGVTFSAGCREVVVEFYNNGTAHSLFADDSTEEMDTRPVTPGPDGHRAFIEEVRQYLYGPQPAAQVHRSNVF